MSARKQRTPGQVVYMAHCDYVGSWQIWRSIPAYEKHAWEYAARKLTLFLRRIRRKPRP